MKLSINTIDIRFRSPDVSHNSNYNNSLVTQTSMGVALFVSPIFWYLSLSVSAFKPCHGNEPRKKYINICPKASRSSRLDCSENRNNTSNIIFSE